jgi:hypothetical protein
MHFLPVYHFSLYCLTGVSFVYKKLPLTLAFRQAAQCSYAPSWQSWSCLLSLPLQHLDPQDDLDEDAFEEYFHLDPVTDPEEHEKRDEALKENEALINGTNEMFMNGQITWWDAVNEFADLPEDEFELEKTGAIDGSMYARGLLEPTENINFY